MEYQSHDASDHAVSGSPYEVMKAVMARHLCGWISGHGAPVDHFLVDADMIMQEAHEAGVRFDLVENHSSVNTAHGFIDCRTVGC